MAKNYINTPTKPQLISLINNDLVSLSLNPVESKFTSFTAIELRLVHRALRRVINHESFVDMTNLDYEFRFLDRFCRKILHVDVYDFLQKYGVSVNA